MPDTEPTWEDVASPQSGDYTERLKVPGGWIYRCVTDPSLRFGRSARPHDAALAIAMVFVPEPGLNVINCEECAMPHVSGPDVQCPRCGKINIGR